MAAQTTIAQRFPLRTRRKVKSKCEKTKDGRENRKFLTYQRHLTKKKVINTSQMVMMTGKLRQ